MLVPLYPASWKSWNAACIILALASLPAIFELPHAIIGRSFTFELPAHSGARYVSESSLRTRCYLGRCPTRSSIDNAGALSIGVQIAETAKNSRYVQESVAGVALRFRLASRPK